MCLMMRRAKSGRVPQTTTGTTYYNMAASDYCEPISLRHVQNTNGGVYIVLDTHTLAMCVNFSTHTIFNPVHTEPIYTEPVDTLKQHTHNCQGEQQQLKCTWSNKYLDNECPDSVQV